LSLLGISRRRHRVMLRPATSMLILTVNGLKVLGPVLAQGPVSQLTG